MNDEILELFIKQYIDGIARKAIGAEIVFSPAQVKFGYAKSETLRRQLERLIKRIH
jgi:hypothetical protein